jgi:hypothetical protein
VCPGHERTAFAAVTPIHDVPIHDVPIHDVPIHDVPLVFRRLSGP